MENIRRTSKCSNPNQNGAGLSPNTPANDNRDLPTASRRETSNLLLVNKEDGCYLGLNCKPVSKEAEELTRDLVESFYTTSKRKRNKRVNLPIAAGAIIADLLKAVSHNPNGYSYRSMGTGTFSGEPIGYRHTKDFLESLAGNGFVEAQKGHKAAPRRASKEDRASTFIVTPKLLHLAAHHGVRPSDWHSHFRRCPTSKLVGKSILLKSSRGSNYRKRPGRGALMKVDYANPKVVAAAKQINEINAFFADIKITAIVQGNITTDCLRGFRRIFNEGNKAGVDYNKGGRLYPIGGGYQNFEKEVRPSIELNGQPTVELDIRASHLTIVHALMGVPLDPETDPYLAVGYERGIAKAFVMQALGNKRLPSRWSKPNKDRYKADCGGDLQKDHPIAAVKRAISETFPLLANRDKCPFTWADLQYIESCAVIDCVHELATVHGIPALPVHDSIIVPEDAEAMARLILSRTFEHHVGVKPFLKVK